MTTLHDVDPPAVAVDSASRSEPTSEIAPRDAGYTAAYIGMAACAAVLVFLLIRFTVDDAFISWRYGVSLTRGHWNWNPTSQDKVEAYSNPLYAALSFIPALLGFSTELFFKILALGIGAAYLRVVSRLAVPRMQRLVLAGFALVNPLFFVHLLDGLETTSFALGISALFGRLYLRGRLDRTGHLLAVAVAFSRPEGILFAAVAEFWTYYLSRRRDDLVNASAVVAGLGVYWLARAEYFGKFFPNPFYLKTADQTSVVASTVKIFHDLQVKVLLFVALIVLAEWLRRNRAGARSEQGRPQRLSPAQEATPVVLAATSALIIFTLYQVSNLQMDFGNRFRWQLIFPIAVVLLARPLFVPRTGAEKTAAPPASARWVALALLIGAVAVLEGGSSFTAHRTTVIVGACAAFLAVLIAWSTGRTAALIAGAVGLMTAVSAVSAGELVGWAVYRYHLEYAHHALGSAIAADRSLDGTIAVMDSGALPFSLNAHQRSLDLGGLADPFLDQPVPPAVLADLSAVVTLGGGPARGGMWWGDTSSGPVFARLQQGGGFDYAQGVPYADGYWLNVYVKHGLGTQLLRALPAMRERAVANNFVPDDKVLDDHLFDFPFLRGRPAQISGQASAAGK
ncbi:hypothetical protein ABH920_001604 [Catenulispora sp. EB89]|uniref:hypothetical protein n=1 Tax=Catenulispora sp. EB89 TaxID=3156257 RepID=UPI003518368C